jgi:3-methyladenine DNA glycosylase AlkD
MQRMAQEMIPSQACRIADQINQEIRRLPVQNAANVRAIRRRYSDELQKSGPQLVLQVARQLMATRGARWVGYELVASHEAAYLELDESLLEELGAGINSWQSVDAFGRALAGPAWRDGLVPDSLIHRWAHSDDRWWRRAALVSTVALNIKSHGGTGDTDRTLAVCALLADDPDDMVVKALSWALRSLVPHDPEAVRRFLADHAGVLAARVKREVRNKLTTGLKNPRRRRPA